MGALNNKTSIERILLGLNFNGTTSGEAYDTNQLIIKLSQVFINLK